MIEKVIRKLFPSIVRKIEFDGSNKLSEDIINPNCQCIYENENGRYLLKAVKDA